MAKKQERIQALIQRNISDIVLFELKNPIMKLVSINGCDVALDYAVAKVYVSHLQKEHIEEAVFELNKAKGAIRTALAKKLDIYKVPELIFIKDETYEKGEHIEQLLKEVKK